ncbi:MAG TPA: PHB depolymerase family esterase [Candidatus Paceibacterota bacterium]
MYKWLIGIAIIVLVAVAFWRLHGFQLLRDGGRDVVPSADFESLEEATSPGDGTLSGSESGSISTPSGSAQAGKSITLTLPFNGTERSYILHIPVGYNSSKRYPLMISYHGEGGSGLGQQQKTGFDAVADENGFFVTYPSAENGDWKITGGANDIEFSKALIGAIGSAYSIDSSRIYVSGFSAGGGMAMAVACAATDTIAGMAYASNTLGDRKVEQCKPTVPIAIVGFSGTKDVGSEGDTRNNYSYQQTAEYWATQNGCNATPAVSHFPDTLTTGAKVTDTKQVWSGCKNGVTVTLYTIEGGGHFWPGGVAGRNETGTKVGSTELDASTVIWDTLSVYTR